MVQPRWHKINRHIIQRSSCTPWHLFQSSENLLLYKNPCMIVHSSFVCNSQQLEKLTCPSVGEWFSKVVHSWSTAPTLKKKKKKMNHWHMEHLGWSQGDYVEWKNQSQKVTYYTDSIYIIFLELEHSGNGEQVSGCQRYTWVGWEDLRGDGIVLSLRRGDGYTHLCTGRPGKEPRTHFITVAGPEFGLYCTSLYQM